jgi:hypothetical protein
VSTHIRTGWLRIAVATSPLPFRDIGEPCDRIRRPWNPTQLQSCPLPCAPRRVPTAL